MRRRVIWGMLVNEIKIGNPKQANVGWVRRMYLMNREDISLFIDPIRYPETAGEVPNMLYIGKVLPNVRTVLTRIDFPKRSCLFSQKIVMTDGGVVYEVAISSETTKHSPDLIDWHLARKEMELLAMLEDQNGTCYMVGNEEHGLRMAIDQQIGQVNVSNISLAGRFVYPVLLLETIEPSILFETIDFESADYSTEYST